jgi:hypothetical protein
MSSMPRGGALLEKGRNLLFHSNVTHSLSRSNYRRDNLASEKSGTIQ